MKNGKEESMEKKPTTEQEQVQIVLTMLQSFEWCGFSATFFLLLLLRWFNFFLQQMYFKHMHTIGKESSERNEKQEKRNKQNKK